MLHIEKLFVDKFGIRAKKGECYWIIADLKGLDVNPVEVNNETSTIFRCTVISEEQIIFQHERPEASHWVREYSLDKDQIRKSEYVSFAPMLVQDSLFSRMRT